MSQINELERRLTAALDRIGAGLETLSEPKPEDPAARADLDRAEAELADERMANAQLEERIKALGARQEAALADLAALRDGTGALEEALADLRRAQDRLEQTSAALRSAAAAGVTDAQAINSALEAELDALRAARRADAAEVGAILAALEPALETTGKDA